MKKLLSRLLPQTEYDKKYLKLQLASNLLKIIPDGLYLKMQYRLKTKEVLNLKQPITYNQKIQWIKLNYRNPILKKCVDKYEVRSYVEDKIGNSTLIPLIGLYSSVDEIRFEELPKKFIVKLTNGSSCNYISYKKNKQDIVNIKKVFNKWLRTDYYSLGREWAYKDVKNRIIIEELLQTVDGSQPEDYRFFCFNGRVEYVTVDYDSVVDGIKTSNYKRNIYDRNWKTINGTIKYPNDKSKKIDIAPGLNTMIKYAEKLSKPFPHVRVDLYYFDNKIYFGELTFYHASGYQKIEPRSLDEQMGALIDIQLITVANTRGNHSA